MQSTGWSEFYTSIIIKSTLSSIYHPFLEILVPIPDWDFGIKAHHHGTQRIKKPNIADITGRRHLPPQRKALQTYQLFMLFWGMAIFPFWPCLFQAYIWTLLYLCYTVTSPPSNKGEVKSILNSSEILKNNTHKHPSPWDNSKSILQKVVWTTLATRVNFWFLIIFWNLDTKLTLESRKNSIVVLHQETEWEAKLASNLFWPPFPWYLSHHAGWCVWAVPLTPGGFRRRWAKSWVGWNLTNPEFDQSDSWMVLSINSNYPWTPTTHGKMKVFKPQIYGL